ncbi:MAG TPA: hypothetical protein VGG61_00985 [Gemmataceae bacterium]
MHWPTNGLQDFLKPRALFGIRQTIGNADIFRTAGRACNFRATGVRRSGGTATPPYLLERR